MRFEQPEPKSRAELTVELGSRDPLRISTALISAALHDEDRFFVESLVIDHLEHPDPNVRGAAATAAGHVARIHRALTLDILLPRLRRLLDDSQTSGHAEDALDDILMFVPAKR